MSFFVPELVGMGSGACECLVNKMGPDLVFYVCLDVMITRQCLKYTHTKKMCLERQHELVRACGNATYWCWVNCEPDELGQKVKSASSLQTPSLNGCRYLCFWVFVCVRVLARHQPEETVCRLWFRLHRIATAAARIRQDTICGQWTPWQHRACIKYRHTRTHIVACIFMNGTHTLSVHVRSVRDDGSIVHADARIRCRKPQPITGAGRPGEPCVFDMRWCPQVKRTSCEVCRA